MTDLSTPPNPARPARGVARYFNKANFIIAALTVYLIALAGVYVCPRFAFALDLVIVAALIGGVAAIACGLTFWHKARVQIGRSGMRYRAVRRAAANIALIGLSFLFVWIASVWSVFPGHAALRAVFPPPPKLKLPMAVARLSGDPDRRIEDGLIDALRAPRANLPIHVVRVDQTAATANTPNEARAFGHLNAIEMLPKDTDLILWGDVARAAGQPIVRLYETGAVAGMQFGGTYIPADFKFPELPLDQLLPVVNLVFAVQTLHVAHPDWDGAGAAIAAPIAPVMRLVNANLRNSRWTADTQARVNFILAEALSVQSELTWEQQPTRVAIGCYLYAIANWATPDHAMDRALALRRLAEALKLLAELTRERKPADLAVTAHQDAIALYNSAPDPPDAAMNQLALGETYDYLSMNYNGTEFPQAIAAYQAALKVFDRTGHPMVWSAIQYAIAVSLADLGLHRADTTNLRQSVAILNDVLLVRNRETVPHAWAQTQVALGEALRQLGEREPASADFAQAATAEKSALEVLNPDDEPVLWSLAEADLGGALSEMGNRDGSTEELGDAIAALRTGLTARLREENAYQWIYAQCTLTVSLEQLAQIEWRQEAVDNRDAAALERATDEHLYEAVAAARAGLEEADEHRNPQQWAYLQSKLGDTLETIGERDADYNRYGATDHLQQAVAADRAALGVMTIHNDPENWADTEATLGDALDQLGKREHNPDDFNQAIAAYQANGQVQTADKDPDSWAATQNSLGEVYENLGMLEKGEAGIAPLQRAVDYYQAALKMTTPDNSFTDWLANQNNLARADAELGKREAGIDHLQQAAAAYREELKYLSADRSAAQWKVANDGLNDVLDTLRLRGATG